MEGNQQKMREALKQALYFLQRHGTGAVYAPDGETLIFCDDVAKIVKEALPAQPRNCDVGTSDEQAERFENFCLKHIGCAEETGGRHCVGCPLEKASRNITQKCELYWAQMPYNKEEV